MMADAVDAALAAITAQLDGDQDLVAALVVASPIHVAAGAVQLAAGLIASLAEVQGLDPLAMWSARLTAAAVTRSAGETGP